jgi:hypothetical protein
MPEAAATVFAALIGAVVGSLGTQLVADRLQRNRERQKILNNLAQLYLLQVKDATRSIRYRLDNIAVQFGKSVMRPDYYMTSTLFILGLFLAYKRILLLHGTYSVMEELRKGWGTELQYQLERFDTQLDHGPIDFHRYDRLALAEALIRWDAGGSRVASSIEFRTEYAHRTLPAEAGLSPTGGTEHGDGGSATRRALEPAEDFVTALGEPDTRSYAMCLAMQLVEIERALEPPARFSVFRMGLRRRPAMHGLSVRVSPSSAKAATGRLVSVGGLLKGEEVELDEPWASYMRPVGRDEGWAVFSLDLTSVPEPINEGRHEIHLRGQQSKRGGTATFEILAVGSRALSRTDRG